MRIFSNCYQLVSEIYREVWEMGVEVHTASMQNKIIKDDDDYKTKEIINYSYCLTSMDKQEYLFLPDKRMLEYCEVEIEDRMNPVAFNPGNSWKVRENIWTEFLDKDGHFDYTYSERMFFQVQKIIAELKKNPNTRQAIISIWDAVVDVDNLGGKKRVPCSVYYQLLLRDNKLHIIYNMRSCDVVTHFGVDVYLAYHLMWQIALAINATPGFLYHNIASLHCYQKDWSILKTCIDDTKNK